MNNPERRPPVALILRLIAVGLVAHVLYQHGGTWHLLARIASAAAVVAVSVRWSHPQFRSHAMIAALCLAMSAFVFAQQDEASYGAQP